jgi:hypothetical protein
MPDDELMSNLEAEMKLVLEKLSPLMDDSCDQPKPEALSKERTIELLNELESLLKHRDARCLDFLEELRSVPGAVQLSTEIYDYNFKKALKCLDLLKTELI